MGCGLKLKQIVIIVVMCALVSPCLIVEARMPPPGLGSVKTSYSGMGMKPLFMDFGYMADSGGIGMDLDLKGDGGANLDDYSMNIKASGIHFGFGAPIDLDELGLVCFSGSFIAPFAQTASERYTDLNAGVSSVSLSWETLTSKASFEGLWQAPIRDNVNVLLGFRYESWEASFSDPSGTANTPVWAEADLDMDLYIPLVGLMMDLGQFSFGVTGLPTLPGSIIYGETLGANERLTMDSSFARGHWAEVWFRYSPAGFNIGPIDAGMGCFATFSSAFGAAEPSIEIESSTQAGLRDIGIYDISVYRRLWTIGLTVQLGLNLPLFE